MERRVLRASQVRAIKSPSGAPRVCGYAATYNRTSSDLGGFVERIAPGAFDRILRTNPDVVCVLNHNENFVLGRTTSGTLNLTGDNRGLYFQCDLPNTTAGKDTYESVKRGDLNGCSFAFTVDNERMCAYREEDVDMEEGDMDEDDDLDRSSKLKNTVRKIVRTIRDFASLVDVSVVTHPAYPGTSVDARNLVAAECRSLIDWRKNEIERLTKLTAELRGQADALKSRDLCKDFVRDFILD
jgi:HK97 family phage prohead protease